MWADFGLLKQLWNARDGTDGGVAAVSGFQYQLAVSLLQLVRTQVVARNSKVFIEAVSDLVSEEGGFLVVTQVKLTLSSGAFRKALKELWEINALASSETPGLVSQLNYRILTSTRLLKDVEAALIRWRPEDDANQAAVEAFRRRVSVRVESDPQQTLAMYLVNAFGDPDPFATVEAWLGRLLADPTNAGFDKSCQSIIAELGALEAAARERAHRFHVWTQDDYPPSKARFEPDPAKATLVGQMPTRGDLSAGRFSPRSLYGSIHEKAEAWLADGLGATPAGCRCFGSPGVLVPVRVSRSFISLQAFIAPTMNV